MSRKNPLSVFELKNEYKEIINNIHDMVERVTEEWKKISSNPPSEVNDVEYFHENKYFLKQSGEDIYLTFSVKKTSITFSLGSKKFNDSISINKYLSKEKRAFPFLEQYLILDALYNSENQMKKAQEYIDKINSFEQKLEDFQKNLEKLGIRKNSIEIKIKEKPKKINAEALTNLINYIMDVNDEIEDKPLIESEIEAFNLLIPQKLDINLNFYSSNKNNNLKFVLNLLDAYLSDNMENMIQRLPHEGRELREIILISMNEENKKKKAKKKI